MHSEIDRKLFAFSSDHQLTLELDSSLQESQVLVLLKLNKRHDYLQKSDFDSDFGGSCSLL